MISPTSGEEDASTHVEFENTNILALKTIPLDLKTLGYQYL